MDGSDQFDRRTLVHYRADPQRAQLLALGVRRETMICNDDDRTNSRSPEVGQNLDTVLIGEIIVEHEQIERTGGEDLECRLAAHRDRSIVAFIFQRPL